MKVLVLHKPGDLRLEDVDEPTPKGNWVKIRVKRVGICGTDKAFYKGTYMPQKLPIIPGHEIAGIVNDVGNKELEHLVGEKVTTEINVHCGKCWYCLHGMSSHCPYRQTIGISIDGGMAEYVLTRADLIHSIEGLSWEEGAFVEPLAAVIEMLEMHPLNPSSNVAVVGIGTMGLLSIQLLNLLGSNVVAVARADSPKRRIAEKLGAEVMTFEEALDFMKTHTPEGHGFDYVVEATGSPKGLEMALNLVRPRGVIAAKSTHGSDVSFNYTLMVVKEVKIVGSRCGPFEKAINLLRKRLINVKNLVTSIYKLEKGIEAFEKSFERDQIKVHLIP
ncbi:MDR/zinc-dependent alcohol dehydrogenase-like family protein [Pyrococcus yayanosii]|uniref:Alcohol dehydrogenase n=1 Tax=Pyrococcus yayanosii (strain CH1 / JCM 16557) TaxID=529709 RepID=F8AJD6_PYRYC|nr:alcohol dehydrogenase catalytic domain-containing protein [Pyrococcus yayanosii]AEH24887.1 alcohol dehydrogenase [Pyrococcus yayanosii CH1]